MVSSLELLNFESRKPGQDMGEQKPRPSEGPGWMGPVWEGLVAGKCRPLGVLPAPDSCPPLSLLTVEGNSDELDEPIKAVFADVAFVKKHNLMSLNSINWSRVLVQMAHHFFAYFQCASSLDTHPLPPVEVVVPTGAAGNLAGKETPGQKWAFQKNACGPHPSSCPSACNCEEKVRALALKVTGKRTEEAPSKLPPPSLVRHPGLLLQERRMG